MQDKELLKKLFKKYISEVEELKQKQIQLLKSGVELYKIENELNEVKNKIQHNQALIAISLTEYFNDIFEA